MSLSNKEVPDVADIFKNMLDVPSIESDMPFKAWVNTHKDSLICGIANGIVIPVENEGEIFQLKNFFTDENLCDIHIPSIESLESTCLSAQDAFERWSCLDKNIKSQWFFRIADAIEKKQKLFSIVESLSSGKHLHKTKANDIPNLIASFRQCGDWLQLNSLAIQEWKPFGVVCVVTDKHNSPYVSTSFRIASILAAGNSAVLLTDKSCSLTAILLAETFISLGLPPGILNVVPVDQEKLQLPPNIAHKFVVSGSEKLCRNLMKTVPSYLTDVHIERRPTVLVYEDADLSSAADGVLDTLFYSETRSESGGCLVLVQESVFELFMLKLELNFSNIMVGCNLSKTDMSCIVTDEQYEKLNLLINDGPQEFSKVIFGSCNSEMIKWKFWKPTLITGVPPSARIMEEEVGGPVILVTCFRTVKESINMCNKNKKASNVSIWSEKLTVALEVSHSLDVGCIWDNSQNIIDASVPYGGVYLSGNAKEGGLLSLLKYSQPIQSELLDVASEDSCELPKEPDNSDTGPNVPKKGGMMLYTGSSVFGTDVDAVVKSSKSTQAIWHEATASRRKTVLYKIGKTLNEDKIEIASYLQDITGSPIEQCCKEIDSSAERVYYWAACADKFCGAIKTAESYGNVSQIYDPVGVIAAICPNENPVLGFLSIVAPAIAKGNSVVAYPCAKYPDVGYLLCRLLKMSKVPEGLVNMLKGESEALTNSLYMHNDVDAIWIFDDNNFLKNNVSCSPNFKNVWFSQKLNWYNLSKGMLYKFVIEATRCKVIYMPMGDIFSN